MSKTDIYKWASADGKFRRLPSAFRNAVSADGEFKPEAGRYHLYVSYACPWAHRTLITRKLKGLENAVSYSVVHPLMGPLGWSFRAPVNEGTDERGVVNLSWHSDKFGEDEFTKDPLVGDPLHKKNYLRELYFSVNPQYEGRFTVPSLWDKEKHTIVNNESAEIVRIFNSQFQGVAEHPDVDLYPEALRGEIDEFNDYIYDRINNGVYRCGFATNQTAYEEAFSQLREALENVDARLANRTFAVGDQLTEADIRLYVTIIRFDAVYYSHFKASSGLIRHTYQGIHRWLKNLYWNYPAFHETTHFDHIKAHYFGSHIQINPTRVIPMGPIPPVEK